MPRQSRLYDITIGIGSHGYPCCPHSIVGFRITGSPNHSTNNLPTSRVYDFAIHTCGHCGVNMCITGSPNKSINNLATHRVHDIVTEFCGIGTTVTGSYNSEVN